MKALVLGGENSFIRDNFAEKLARFNIEVASIWHWDHQKPIAKIPVECDCVIVIKDMTGHVQRNVVRQLAKRQGLRFIEIPRKWAVAQQHLLTLGFKPVGEGDAPTPTVIDGEDFAATFARVVDRAYDLFKATGNRPKATGIATDLKIPTWHLAMQKGIATGVAKANGEDFDPAQGLPDKGWSLDGMVEMCLTDYPDMVRNRTELFTFMADMLDKENGKGFQKKVKSSINKVKKRWVRCSRKANTHPDRIYIDGLKTKWFEDFARDHYEKEGDFPEYSFTNVYARNVFDSQLTKTIYNTVVDSLNEEVNPTEDVVVAEVNKAAETALREWVEGEDGDGDGDMTHTTEDTMPVEPVTDDHAISMEPVTMEAYEPESEPVVTEVDPDVAEPQTTGKRTRKIKSKSLRESIAKYFDMLGKVHDNQIAELAGCSSTSVRNFRIEMGIPSWRKSKKEPPVLQIQDFSASDDGVSATIKALEQKVADLERELGRLKQGKASATLGSKVDELVEAGFKVKLEVTN